MRVATWATLFIAFVLVLLPARVLMWSGVARPTTFGPWQWAGLALVVLGGVLALWCIITFATHGRGTPAPFDPPRRLVVRGPYRHVRNPMYLGAGIALAGAALYYRSLALVAYLAVCFALVHLFVIGYEEPTLGRTFGDAYAAYRQRVRRWWPTW